MTISIYGEQKKGKQGAGIDVLFVSGDAYADHPSNGVAVLAHLLDDKGYAVGILDQPDCSDATAFHSFGTPRLFVAVTAGLMDSMVANYTPMKRERTNDRMGYEGHKRPDRACIAYSQIVRRELKGMPLVIGGIEASLRRFAHYDYWQNKARKSILLDSKADVLVYGMGERQILEIAEQTKGGRTLDGIPGTCIKRKEPPNGAELLPSFDDICASKRSFMGSFLVQRGNQRPGVSPPLSESYGDWHVVQYPPAAPLTTDEMDYLYELPFTRAIRRTGRGTVHAIDTVQFSLITHRGCFGNCSFCSLAMHQGTAIQSRSRESVMREAESFLSHPDFKGIIDDVGGPTANMYGMGCGGGKVHIGAMSLRDGSPVSVDVPEGSCDGACLHPLCPKLSACHGAYRELLCGLRGIRGIRRVFVHSGIRHDLALLDEAFVRDLCAHHVSGQLKIAPEHADNTVLAYMHKPPLESFVAFRDLYRSVNDSLGKRQYLVPYIMVAHPGTTPQRAKALGTMLRSYNIPVEQVQVFTPTPMTLSTAMYYTGLDEHLRQVYVPYSYHEKKIQKRQALNARKH